MDAAPAPRGAADLCGAGAGRDGDLDLLTEMWMLRQPETVRESYIEEVLQPELGAANAR